MQRARVIGTATASIRHDSLASTKLLVIQPLLASGGPDGFPIIAVDTVGAGPGETVMISSDGRFSREWLDHPTNPVRFTVVGIEDE